MEVQSMKGDLVKNATDGQEETILKKMVFPTGLSSAQIRIFWTKALKEKALFSARTTSKQYLEKLQEILAEYQKSLGQTQAGIPISQGTSRSRAMLMEELDNLGLIQRDTDGNTVERMTNLGSQMRLNLIIKTNTELAHSAHQKMTAQDPLQKIIRPYFELVRDEQRTKQRNWFDRWITCANMVNWQGVVKGTSRMIARTDSPIWFELGHIFPDSIGVDTPPFAWNSGMGWKSIREKEIQELGLEVG